MNLLISIDAKYIHTNLAVRLLKANTIHNVDIKEFTINDSLDKITSNLDLDNYNTIGFSCYIWNIHIIKDIISYIKENNKDISVIIGGPEVSRNYNILDTLNVDFMISGDGEHAYDQLLTQFYNNKDYYKVPNLTFRYNTKIITNDILANDLSNINQAHDILFDSNKVHYIESSRGCPYNCAYCVSAIDKGVRFYDISTVLHNLEYLLSNGVKIIKFLDRTFNANIKSTIAILDYLEDNYYKDVSIQFEITADKLSNIILDKLSTFKYPNYIRFEVGIQSTNNEVNKLINRHQDNELALSVIKTIANDYKIDIHADLIAGLPSEDLSSFKNSFNDLYFAYPSEIQVGILKVLNATPLERLVTKYDIKYNNNSPYNVYSTSTMSSKDFKLISEIEQLVNRIYNNHYLKDSIDYYISKNNILPFDFFSNLNTYFLDKYENYINKQVHEFYVTVYNYFKDNNVIDDYLYFLIKKEYLLRFNIRPKIWFDKLDKTKRNLILNYIKDNNILDLSINDLYKYSTVITSNNNVFIVLYKNNNKMFKDFVTPEIL